MPDFLSMEAVKNNLVDARKKYKALGAAMSASSGEAGVYFSNRQVFSAAGAEIEECKERLVEFS